MSYIPISTDELKVQTKQAAIEDARIDLAGTVRALLQSEDIQILAQEDPNLGWWVELLRKRILAIDAGYEKATRS